MKPRRQPSCGFIKPFLASEKALRVMVWLFLLNGLVSVGLTQDQAEPVEPAKRIPSRDEKQDSESQKLTPNLVDGPKYEVEFFSLDYAQPHPDHPALDSVRELSITLGVLSGRLVAPREELESVSIQPFQSKFNKDFHASALDLIARSSVKGLKKLGLVGVFVAPHPQDINPRTGKDLRKDGKGRLRFLIWTARVKQIRTIAQGDRIPEEDRVNHPGHAFVLENSPLNVPEGDIETGDDLIQRDLLDNYVFWLSRHPGRRVDVALSRYGQSGEVSLDYIINEAKPWLAYLSLSNTGTEQTDEWREHLGFVHHQLIGRDDIFNLDYVTAGFDSVHAVLGSYSFPLDRLGHYRLRLGGNWSEFTASDVGIVDEDFKGEGWEAFGELSMNLYQHRQLFIDAYGNLRWKYIEIDNEVVDVQGEDDLLLPKVGVRMERLTDLSSLRGEVALEWNLADLADTEQFDLDRLGRLNPDVSYQILSWNFGWSFFLEPIFNRDAWEDVSDPAWSSLAHELVLSFRGQYSFNKRLIPQAQGVSGGLHSVRGYPESIVAGDTLFIANLEYRFHLPRSFEVQTDPQQTLLFGKPFRFSPQQHYGRADWDLIFIAFLDAARLFQSERLPTFEKHSTLFGGGFGVEFQFKHYLTLRADWGFALKDLDNQDVDDGDSEFHFVGTFLF